MLRPQAVAVAINAMQDDCPHSLKEEPPSMKEGWTLAEEAPHLYYLPSLISSTICTIHKGACHSPGYSLEKSQPSVSNAAHALHVHTKNTCVADAAVAATIHKGGLRVKQEIADLVQM